MVSMMKSAIKLLPYQLEWIKDNSRFKIWLKARQIGASFVASLEAVLDCVERPATTWIFLSAGETQAKELVEKAAMHCRALNIVTQIIEIDFVISDEKIKLLRIDFPNGSRIIGLPANPSTARSFAGNVLLDEFAHHRDARAIYKALTPSVTRGYKIRVISTPAGRRGKFYELWTHNNAYSKHKTDIYKARAMGLEIDIDELREAIDDEDAWLEEYCCEFLSDAESYIPIELITNCESVDATKELPDGFEPRGLCYLGVDIARRRDLTIIYIVELLGDVHWTRMIRELQRTQFRLQREAIEEVLPLVQRCAIDSSGLGMQLAEELSLKYGPRVEPVEFNLKVKEDLAVRVKRKFEERQIRIPDDRSLRADINSVKKYTTIAGHVRFDAERTDQGHADRFWALALALYAADRPVWAAEFKSAGRRESYAAIARY